LNFAYPAPGRFIVEVDAENGQTVSVKNKLDALGAKTTGTGIDVFGNKVNLNITKRNGSYILLDQTHTGDVRIWDLQHGAYDSPAYDVENATANFTSPALATGVTAHKNLVAVYDYYLNTFGYDSFDGDGAKMNGFIHFGTNYENAFWDGYEMTFGDGDGKRTRSFAAALDVVGHEITHGVVEYSAELDGNYQGCQLNESTADTFGEFITRDTTFEIGEDLTIDPNDTSMRRSMENPEAYGQPGTMEAYNKLGDHEAHQNGVPNHAAFFTIDALGFDKAEQIYFNALENYYSYDTDFSDARKCLIASAEDLYGTGSDEAKAVTVAWDKVGVE
jgi:Zn-dependent metalloprotease